MTLWWLALLPGLLSQEPEFAQADPYGGDPFQTFQRPDLKKEFVRNAPTIFDAIRVQPSRRGLASARWISVRFGLPAQIRSKEELGLIVTWWRVLTPRRSTQEQTTVRP